MAFAVLPSLVACALDVTLPTLMTPPAMLRSETSLCASATAFFAPSSATRLEERKAPLLDTGVSVLSPVLACAVTSSGSAVEAIRAPGMLVLVALRSPPVRVSARTGLLSISASGGASGESTRMVLPPLPITGPGQASEAKPAPTWPVVSELVTSGTVTATSR